MKSNFAFMTLLLILACATQVASDIYIPSLVSISDQLPGGTIHLAQLSIVIFLFGVSLTQLIFGPLSEGIGRKRPMLIELVIMIAGSALCASAGSIQQLILGRLIQGMGAGALAALWRTIFRDIMTGEALAKYSSFVSIFMVFVVSIAPALGGYFEYLGWRSSFMFMLAYAFVALVALQCIYRETNSDSHLDKLAFSYIIKNYKVLLSSPVFMGMTLCTFLCYGALFSWIVVAPSLLMNSLSLTPIHFGWTMAIVGCLGYCVAAIANSQLVQRLGMEKMMWIGWASILGAGLLLLAGSFIWGITFQGIIFPILLFYFGSTLIWPNAFSIAFSPFGHIAGFAGSLYGFLQLIGGAIMGSIAAHVPSKNQNFLAFLIIGTALLSIFIYKHYVAPNRITEREKG